MNHPLRTNLRTSVRTGTLCALSLVAGLALVGTMQGCLISSNRSASVSGREVTSTELDSIKPGETREVDVLALLGPPTSTVQMSDGGKLYTWSATTRERSAGTVLLIFAGASEKSTTRSVSIACSNGLVTSVNVR
jgi:outer membrane protein assembly factor BamE (lipoprotein component of BamABCDE complex)